MLVCYIYNQFGGCSFRSVLRHIGEVHKHDPYFFIRCGIVHCPQTYKNYDSFRSHVYRKHRDALCLTTTQENRNVVSANEFVDDPYFEETNRQPSLDFSMQERAAKFVLKAREEYRIPQTKVNKLLKDVAEMVTLGVDQTQQFFLKKQRRKGSITVKYLSRVLHLKALRLNTSKLLSIKSTLIIWYV